MTRLAYMAGLALLMSTSAASADGPLASLLSANDHHLLADHDRRRDIAIAEARAAADPATRATLDTLLASKTVALDEREDLGGPWRCRYLKLGKSAGLAIYGWFQCRIRDDGGWVIQKTTGSQRTRGRLYRLNALQHIYLGALHYGYEMPTWFGQDPSRNQLALVKGTADGRLLLEFPAPLAESALDILELAR
jgi:hypothetical protein